MGEKTVSIFEILDEGTDILKEELNIPYLDALAELGDMLFQKEIIHPLKHTTTEKMQEWKAFLMSDNKISPEEFRKAFQLAVLKGMRSATQPHHEMTPDAVSLFIGYLVNKIISYEKKEEASVILDPAVGAGNLLTAVMNQLNTSVHGIGAEADETLLRLCYVNANFQKHTVDLFHQDSIATPFVKNVDAIISDLPVGFYPNDAIANNFELHTEEGHSFVHHLLIEQSILHVKPGGFLFFVVPNFIFESDQASSLHEYLKKEGIIYSFMQLPKSMFKNEQWGKSILIIRKRKEGINEPKQALLVELPSFSNEIALRDIMQRISTWFEDHLKKII
ncbi:class I SAM-dependent methyltransferase [Evansella sp. AB-P1]|uniref:class I SAM-dependent methyltransferase n=1 Tax=Evansella sp. AB-P1 TaxID=3037653 RepID=UPI00241EEBD1|nr:class I SAM-dependent methyltransferase [Evansella sp. AB-P1]MDG5787001.1 class I SAM-dependent methyltransferase [Evansella sp. AB-P1]